MRRLSSAACATLLAAALASCSSDAVCVALDRRFHECLGTFDDGFHCDVGSACGDVDAATECIERCACGPFDPAGCLATCLPRCGGDAENVNARRGT